MASVSRSVAAVVFGWALLASVAGCDGGPKRIIAKGKLVDGTAVVKPDDNRSYNLIFTPESAKVDEVTRQVGLVNNPEGEFELRGNDNRGIPAGKYRVTFQVTDPSPSPRISSLQNRFGKDPSPIVVDIQDEKPFVIDLATIKK